MVEFKQLVDRGRKLEDRKNGQSSSLIHTKLKTLFFYLLYMQTEGEKEHDRVVELWNKIIELWNKIVELWNMLIKRWET